MIQFACHACGAKFRVKPEFTGKATKCPTCKQALVVPAPVAALAPAQHIDGPPSSLDHAGVDDEGVTLPPTMQPQVPEKTFAIASRPVAAALAQKKPTAGRYLIEEEIARGGMGAVLRGIDRDLRREVAIKFMLQEQDKRQKARFVEEAQITGQLEHPNIVPIHELGVDAQKRLFFTMKMVKGKSLAQILKDHADNPREAEKDWPLSRLLTAYIGICHALAYAHSRGVIHRDLKPANIMLGDFGEVYVMDWGLAKVLSERENLVKSDAGGTSQSPASAAPIPRAASGIGQTTVTTGRGGGDGELTQDGAILGTPAYMPPEQARGEVLALDARSDIYSLGAILYALLTLEPPVEKGGDYIALLMRVVEGKIKRPEERAPKRFVPPELSAIAMKALAKEPKDRYAGVEELRRDIERFQEGRSVSAKRDTAWEALAKFVKRNKGLSAGLGLALCVLLGSLVVLFSAWRETKSAYTKFEKEQTEKEQRTRRSIPAFLESARRAITKKDFGAALNEASLALEYDPASDEAMLLTGQLQVATKEYRAAAQTLEKYAKLRPDDKEPTTLAKLCIEPDPSEAAVQQQIGTSLVRQNQVILAADFFGSSKERLEVYRKQIEQGYPGKKLGSNLKLDRNGHLVYHAYVGSGLGAENYADLSPFRGLPLSRFDLSGAHAIDLSPLKGMPLVSMRLASFKNLRDLSGLKGIPLQSLNLINCASLTDLSSLAEIPLEVLQIESCMGVKNISALRNMPLRHLQISTGSGTYLIEDLTPLEGLSLESLHLDVRGMKSLEMLRGMPLKNLDLQGGQFLKDLTPLQGMPLESLQLEVSSVTDLRPLQGLPLKHLNIGGLKARDMSQLEGLQLESLVLPDSPKKVQGIETLRGMDSLRSIGWYKGPKFDAEEFWKKYDAGELK